MWQAARRLFGLAWRGFASGSPGTHILPDLPYSYDALKPNISKEIMLLHHLKHHKGYVDMLNKVETVLKSAIVQNNIDLAIKLSATYIKCAGGHINHSLFWKNIGPCGSLPSGPLERAINEQFGNLCNLKTIIIAIADNFYGSGWIWLTMDIYAKHLTILPVPRESSVKHIYHLEPLLGIDLWEHAYYPQYGNRRTDYVRAIFELINWDEVGKRFNEIHYCQSKQTEIQ